MMGMRVNNIDTILVNPSEEDKIRDAFASKGFADYASMIVPCIYVKSGQMILSNSKVQINVDIGMEGENDAEH